MTKRANNYLARKKEKKFWHNCLDLAIKKNGQIPESELMSLWRQSQTCPPDWVKIKAFVNE